MAIDTLLRFKRLQDLTTDKAVIIAALKDSDLLVVDEAGTKVTWADREALKKACEQKENPADALTVVVSGFPKNTVALSDMQAILEKNNLSCSYIRMIKQFKAGSQEGVLTGMGHLVCKDKESFDKLLAFDFNTDGRTGVKVQSKEAFEMEKEQQKAASAANQQKKLQEELIKAEKDKAAAERFQPTPDFVPKRLVQVSGCPEQTSRETFKQYMLKLYQQKTENADATLDDLKGTEYELEWCCYTRDAPTGCFKFTKPVTKALITAFNKDTALTFPEGSQVTFSIMEGDEAKAQWAIIESEKEEMKSKAPSNNKKRHGGKRNGKPWGSKQRRD